MAKIRYYRVTMKNIKEETWFDFINENVALDFMKTAYEHGESFVRYTLTIEEREDDF